MTARERLPDRREHDVVEFDIDGVEYRASVGRFDDGRIAELFLDGPKIGSAASTAARDGAIAASLALQHGVPADTLRHALTRLRDGNAAGPIGRALDLIDGGGGA